MNLDDQSFTCQAFPPKLGYLESNEAGNKFIKLSNLGRLENFQKMSFTWKHEITCTPVEWNQINQQLRISQALQSAGVQKPLTGKEAEVWKSAWHWNAKRLRPYPLGDPALVADERCGQENTGCSEERERSWSDCPNAQHCPIVTCQNGSIAPYFFLYKVQAPWSEI